MTNKTKRIRELNDRFRRGDKTVPGKFTITCGVNDLLTQHDRARQELAAIIQSFDDFTADNDPFREHDFGVFIFLDQKCFWKLDYYSLDLKWASEDPSDPKQTMRILTVMLAIEY